MEDQELYYRLLNIKTKIMYYSNQTLRHKISNRLAALHPLINKGSSFNWEIGKKTSFIDEFGVKFTDDIDNWTHIEDWFGRPVSYTREKSESKFVNTALKQYLFVSDKDREYKKQKALEEWRDRILKQLETEDYIQCWYSDGSKCPIFRTYFMEYVKAKPLIYTWCNIMKVFTPKGHTFKYKGRKFFIGFGCHDQISLIKPINFKD
jgi:hypothetical protein